MRNASRDSWAWSIYNGEVCVCLSRFFLIFHSIPFYKRGSSQQVENMFVCLFVIMAFAGASLKSTQTFATNFLIFTNPPLSLQRDSSKLKTWWSFEKIRSKIDAKMKYSEWFRFICWRWSAGDNRKWKSPPILFPLPKNDLLKRQNLYRLAF